MKGLDPQKRYRNEQTGLVLSGDTLMNAGLCIHEKLRDFDSCTFHLVAVD